MFRVSVADVLLPTLTTWGQLVRKFRIHLQRERFSPRDLSLVMRLEGTFLAVIELPTQGASIHKNWVLSFSVANVS
jgi:hypothetical protein